MNTISDLFKLNVMNTILDLFKFVYWNWINTNKYHWIIPFVDTRFGQKAQRQKKPNDEERWKRKGIEDVRVK